jgi:hypothetical protein
VRYEEWRSGDRESMRRRAEEEEDREWKTIQLK